MSTTQIPSPVSVENKVEVVTPNAGISPVGRSAQLQSVLPGFRYQNPIAFRNNMVSDTAFRQSYMDQLFDQYQKEDPTMAQAYQQDPEKLAKARRNTEANILNQLYAELSTGEDLADAISRRGADLAARNFNPSRVPDYVNTIRMAPENYQALGLTDGRSLVADYQSNPQLIGQLVRTDQNVRTQIYKDRFNAFVQTIGNSNNRAGIDTNNPDEVAKAFAIFENYGSEGLTQYVNYFQKYIPGVPLEEQDRNVRMAHSFFSTRDTSGRDPKEVVRDFIGSPDSPLGQLTYQPRAMSAEVGNNVPLDLNAFTRFFQTPEQTKALLSAASAGTFESVDSGNISQTLTVNDDQLNTFLTSFRENIPTKETYGTLFDIMALARTEQGFTQRDLLASIAVHATPTQGERGAIEYVFNPEDLPETARIAYEALQLDHTVGGGARLFRNAGDGMIAMEPARQERIQEQAENFRGYRLVNQSRLPIYDGNGAIVGFKSSFEPEVLSWSFDYTGLMLGRAGQFFTDYLITPMVEATAKTMEYVGRPDVADNITSSDFFTRMREAADFDAYEKTTGFWNGGNALLFTDLGLYIAGAIAIGKAAAATGGAALGVAAGRAATAAASSRNAALAGQYLQSGMAPTRFQAVAMKAGKMLNRTSASPHLTMVRGEIGAAVLETAGGTRRSMLANPFIDNLFENVGLQTELEKTYAISNNLTRMGIDIAASVGIGLTFDNIWAGVKYAGNLGRTARGKTARGLELTPDGRDYIKTDEAVFAPEWRRFMYEATNGLQDMPLGSLADTQANLFLGRGVLNNLDNIETLEDAMAVMNHNMGDFFQTMKTDIEKTVRYWDEQFGGKMSYDETQLQQRVSDIYQELQDKIADGIVTAYRHQNPDKVDLVQLMAQRMRDQGTTVMSVPMPTTNGNRYLMSMQEANTLAANTPNGVVREVTQPNGSVLYSVQKVDEGYWGFSMADALMRRYSRTTADDVIDRNIARMDIRDSRTPFQRGVDAFRGNTPQKTKEVAEMSKKAEEVVGKEIYFDNQRGYITDFDVRKPGTYTVRTIDGIEHKNVMIPDRLLNPGLIREQDVVQTRIRPRTSPGIVRGLLPQNASPDDAFRLRQAAQQTLEKTDFDQFTFEFDSGLPLGSNVELAKRAGVGENFVRETLTKRFSEQIESAQKQLAKTEKDKRLKNPEKREQKLNVLRREIAELEDQLSEYDDMITKIYGGSTRELADTAFGQRVVGNIEGADWTGVQTKNKVKISKFVEAKAKARTMRNDARRVSGSTRMGLEPSTGPFRKEYGVGSPMMYQIARLSGGELLPSVPSVRRVVMGLGSDNNMVDNITRISYNKGEVKPLRVGPIKKHTAVLYDGDLYMARQAIDAETLKGTAIPSVWMPDKHYGLTMNPYWARVNRNATVDPVTGELGVFVRDGHGRFGPIYREATDADSIDHKVYLNIQKPVLQEPKNIDVVIGQNIDAIETNVNGVRRYEVMNEVDQTVGITNVHNLDPNFGLRSRHVESQGIC
jgi:hypothetical protein